MLLISGCSTGQDSPKILNDSWVKLKKELQRRSNIALDFISDTAKLGKSDKGSADMIRSGVADFKRFIDSTKSLDSITVQLVKRKALESTQLISDALKLRMGDSSFTTKDFRDFQTELEGAELRINWAKKDFNQLCVQFKRSDLVFK